MPYKDKAKQTKFQMEWMNKRRSEWLKSRGNKCSKCGSGSVADLVVVRPNGNSLRKSIWTYSDSYRSTALKGCKPFCKPCMVKHYGEKFKKMFTGKKGRANILSPDIVWAIRGRLAGKEGTREIARSFGIHHSAIQAIQKGKTWSWLKPGRRKVYGINWR